MQIALIKLFLNFFCLFITTNISESVCYNTSVYTAATLTDGMDLSETGVYTRFMASYVLYLIMYSLIYWYVLRCFMTKIINDLYMKQVCKGGVTTFSTKVLVNVLYTVARGKNTKLIYELNLLNGYLYGVTQLYSGLFKMHIIASAIPMVISGLATTDIDMFPEKSYSGFRNMYPRYSSEMSNSMDSYNVVYRNITMAEQIRVRIRGVYDIAVFLWLVYYTVKLWH